MTDETEICEIDECENSAQVIISEENSTEEMRVCHECEIKLRRGISILRVSSSENKRKLFRRIDDLETELKHTIEQETRR